MLSRRQLGTELRAEHELLLSCARIELEPAGRERIAVLLRQPVAWDWLYREATRHGLISLVHRHLRSMDATACPTPLWQTWTQDSLGVLANNLRLAAELDALGKDLRTEAIPFLCLKGPALTASLYRDLRLRPSGDLDLVVRPADARRAHETLLRRGFVPQFELAGPWWDTFLRTRCELAFRRQRPAVLAELHWGLLPPGYSFTPDLAACWERAEAVCVESVSVETLGLEDNLLFLCLHAAKHDWQRLIWLVDLAELLRQRREVDWDRLLPPVRVGSAGLQVQVSLLLAARWLAAPVPAEVWRRLPPEDRADRIVRRVMDDQRMAADPALEAGRTQPWRQLYFQAMQLRRDRLRYLYDVLLRPTPIEWRLLPLPAWLAPLHLVVRPMRLLGRHLLRCMRLLRSRRS